jgi:GNAT superfamily N-acetyltransferase
VLAGIAICAENEVLGRRDGDVQMTVSDPITIRSATSDDAAEVARLAGELGYPTAPAEAAARLALIVGNPKHAVLVAETRGGKLAGWAHVEHRQSLEGGERAELMGLVVDAAARRAGLGRLLLDSAEEWSRQRGLKALTVRSNAARRDSHPFYEAAGFEAEKTQHVYVKPLG